MYIIENTSHRLYVIGLLMLSFISRIVIYFNTKLFYFSDFKAYIDGMDRIAEVGSIPLINGNFLYLNSYIGYFFKYVLGSIHYYFIFNSALAVLASYIVYRSVILLTNNYKAGLLTLFLHLIYTEFLCWSSIFYTPIIGIFLLSIVIYLSIYLIKSGKIKRDILTILMLLITINGSFFFKGELKHFYILFMIFGLINFRKKAVFLKFILLGLLLFSSTFLLNSNHILPYNKGNIQVNDFIFFGHTLYGGDGGDGAFIYEENEQSYNLALDKYLKEYNISDNLRDDRIVRNNFQKAEIKRFITNHPFQWIKLQGYKFFRFFGVVPEGVSAKILLTGIFKGNFYLTALFLVFPFAAMILGIILLSDLKRCFKALKRPEYMLLFLMVGYYIVGSVFYGQYQERYRLPLMVCLLIPYLSHALINFNLKSLKIRNMQTMVKGIIIMVVVLIWSSQVYSVLVVHKDRYKKTITEVNQIVE